MFNFAIIYEKEHQPPETHLHRFSCFYFKERCAYAALCGWIKSVDIGKGVLTDLKVLYISLDVFFFQFRISVLFEVAYEHRKRKYGEER